MKKEPLVNIVGDLDAEALRILRDIPEVAVDSTPTHRPPDIVLRAGDVTYPVEVRARRTANAATARQLAHEAGQLPLDVRLVVVARDTTEDARRILDEAGVGVIDTAGNLRVRLPGVFLWAEGRRVARTRTTDVERPPAKLVGKASIVAQALLMEPHRHWHVKDAAARADASSALAHRVLARLEREGLVVASGSGPNRTRQLTDPTALLDLWVEEMTDRDTDQRRAFRLARDPRAEGRALSDRLARANIEHAVTGAAAATLLAPFVTTVPVTDVWIADTTGRDRALTAIDAEPVREGHNITLRWSTGDGPLAFREQVDDVWVVNRFRLYHDLRQDPRRGREQADHLREEVIGF